MNERFYTVPQVAEMIGISVPRAYQMAAAGGLPSILISPKRRRVPVKAFEAWLMAREMEALESLASGGNREPVAT